MRLVNNHIWRQHDIIVDMILIDNRLNLNRMDFLPKIYWTRSRSTATNAQLANETKRTRVHRWVTRNDRFETICAN